MDKGVRIETWKDRSGARKIQRIVVTGPGIATDKGARVGMTWNQVRQLDPEAIITPHSTDSGKEPVLLVKRDKLAIFFIHELTGKPSVDDSPNKSVDQIWLATSDDDLIGGC